MKPAKLARRNGRLKILTLPERIKLDLGAGSNKKPGFWGVDKIAFPGVDQVIDLTQKKRVISEIVNGRDVPASLKVGDFIPWPWDNDSVEEAHCSHFLEHLTPEERIHFFNELHRVLIPGGKCTMITPHWCSCRAYGDPTHKWPPVSEFLWYYLKRDWRLQQAPHTDSQHNPQGFTCNFEVTWGYGLQPEITVRNMEYQQMAISYYKEACTDMAATLVKS